MPELKLLALEGPADSRWLVGAGVDGADFPTLPVPELPELDVLVEDLSDPELELRVVVVVAGELFVELDLEIALLPWELLELELGRVELELLWLLPEKDERLDEEELCELETERELDEPELCEEDE